MIDLQLLRKQPQLVHDNLVKRGYTVDLAKFEQIDGKLRLLRGEVDEIRAARNRCANEVAKLRQQGADFTQHQVQQKVAEAEAAKLKLQEIEQQLDVSEKQAEDFLLDIPNLLSDQVVDGRGEQDNKLVITHGDIPEFSFTPQDHQAIGERLDGLDFSSATMLARSRFVLMRSDVARLHRALAQFMLDLHVSEHGYVECNVPVLVNETSMRNTGQLPKFAEDLFAVGDDLFLIPTAEVPLTNMLRAQRLRQADFGEHSLRFVAHSLCFRREAGSYGKDTRGMLRQHQFEKVELVHISLPERSYQMLEEMSLHAQEVLKRLGLAYRLVSLCSGDIGFAAALTYDIEVWLPGQNAYREISSCSNCTDFQARRMNFKYTNAQGKREFVHTLNGSGVAVGRLLIAVLENYQCADGSVVIPKCLHKYMSGQEKIVPALEQQ